MHGIFLLECNVMNREKTYKSVFFFLLLLPALSLRGSGQDSAQAPDSWEILRKAAAAVKKLNAVEYDAVYTGHGAMANYPGYAGRVALERTATPFGLRAKVSVTGKGFYPGEAAARVYAHSYDGETVRWLDHVSRSLVARVFSSSDLDDKTWGTVTGHLGRAGASTILWELLSEEPFARALEGAHLEYMGAITVEGELCHIIFQEETHPVSKRKRMQQWYISAADFLPRRKESLSNRDGRIGVLALTLSRMKASDGLSPGSFELDIPDGYSTAAYQAAEKKSEGLAVGTAAPEWSAVDSSSENLSLSYLKGRIVVLDFWAEWCVPCKQAMPVMQRLHEKYSHRGVSIIGIHCFAAKGGKPPLEYIRLKKYTYSQITAGDEIAKSYGVNSLPTLYVIDQSGQISFFHIGYKEDLESDLNRIIETLIEDK
jgi:thiol-disulfide isomerase/thioredoxin